jgi:hypothetical protein
MCTPGWGCGVILTRVIQGIIIGFYASSHQKGLSALVKWDVTINVLIQISIQINAFVPQICYVIHLHS